MSFTRRRFMKTTACGLAGALALKGGPARGECPRCGAAPASLTDSLAGWFTSYRPDLDRVLEFIKWELGGLIDLGLNAKPGQGPRLPYPVIPVAADKQWLHMFYWDTYFIVRLLLDHGRLEIAKNQVKNCCHLIDRFGYVPNADYYLWATRSQPPLLSSMVRLIFEREGDASFLELSYPYLEREHSFWIGKLHLVREHGFSRYQDLNLGTAYLTGFPASPVSHLQSECESGWDFTPRFENRCLDFLPVDLNAFLYKCEQDLAGMAEKLGRPDAEIERWQERAESRQKKFERTFWDPERGFYFDYDFKRERQGRVWSLAGYVPFWAGLGDDEQARAAQSALSRFEREFGLCACDEDYGMDDKQWNFPNAWPPLQWWTEQVMSSRGFVEDGLRIAMKYLDAQTRLFKQTGEIYEKYNAVTGGLDTAGRYPAAPMMGWSASTFVDFYQRIKAFVEK